MFYTRKLSLPFEQRLVRANLLGLIAPSCTALNMLKQYQGKHYLVLNDQVLAKHEKQMKKKRIRIVPDRLNWTPPKFSRDQLRALLY